MNTFYKVILWAAFSAFSVTATADGHGEPKGLSDSPNKKLAVAWVSAGYTGMDEVLAITVDYVRMLTGMPLASNDK